MLYKQYGKTGKKVSVIGFGGMRFTQDNGAYDMDKSAQLLVEANKLGINYFDTAPYYCDDLSQKIFGLGIKEMPNEFYISTKSSERDGSKLRRDLESSLSIIGVEKINFFHIWCVLNLKDYESRLVKDGAYEAAQKAKEEGLIEHIVISTHAPGEEIEKIAEDKLFDGITLGYNILNFNYREKGIRACYKNKLGVVTMNPLGGGVIPQNAEKLSFIKSETDRNVTEAAIRFNLSHDEITVALVGLDSIAHLHEVCDFTKTFEKYSSKKIDELKSMAKESLNELCTGCRYCEHCPEGVEVSKFMYAYNQKILGSVNDSLNTLKYHWSLDKNELDKCVECGLCEEKCTQHLQILQRFAEMKSW